MDEIIKSIKATLYDRVTSPLSGTLIASWITWNWRIFYVTFFLDQEDLIDSKNKLDYIQNYLENPDCHWNLIWWPLITSAFFILIFPFISSGAYWLHLWFKNLNMQSKIIFEDKGRLSVEDSTELRKQLRNIQEEYIQLDLIKNENIEKKEKLIQELKAEIETNLSKITVLEDRLDEEKKELDFSTIWKGEWIFETYNPLGKKNTLRKIFEVNRGNKVFFVEDRSEFTIHLFRRSGYDSFSIILSSINNVNRTLKLIFLERKRLDVYTGEAFEIDCRTNEEPHFKYSKLNLYKADEFGKVEVVDELEEI